VQRWLDGSGATGMDPDARSASVVQPNRRRGIHGSRLRELYLTAGLGPKSPFTHTPRLHEHDADAQADTGTLMSWVLP
jgi:hypothetical protein